MLPRIIKIYNDFHLGDNIFNFILFYNIKDYIENNNIYIEYYCYSYYYDQVKEFNCSKNITLYTIEECGKQGIQLWIGNSDFEIHNFNFFTTDKQEKGLDEFLVIFFNQFLKIAIIDVKINKFEYQDNDLQVRYKQINSKTNNKYLNLDVLILNSIAMSGQYYEQDSWVDFIKKINKKKRIATTEKIDDIVCTRDDNLTIKDIAAISTCAKIIIMVNSGVAPGLFNNETLNYVKAIYCFDYNYIYKNPVIKDTQNIDELYFLIDDNE